MSLFVAPAGLASLYSGPPLLLALAGLPGLEALALEGLALWLVTQDGAALRLHRPGEAPELATEALPAAAPVLALVAPSAAAAAPLAEAWAALGGEAPPQLLAADAPAALPALARLAVAALAQTTAELGQAQRGLVATRQDYEATRIAVARLEQSLGGRMPAPPTLRLQLEPGAGLVVQAGLGPQALSQGLGLPVDGLCTVALHVAEARMGPASQLRLRLLGAEGGQVLAAWRPPGAALRPGWLLLDLPSPLPALRQTALLELAAELAPGDALAFSLEDRLAQPGQAVQGAHGPASTPPRALALRAWGAEPGQRHCLPAWWDADQLGLPLAPEGLAVALPAQAWAAARLSPGHGRLVQLGTAAPRPLLHLAPGEQALVLLPWVPLLGLDLLEASLTLLEGRQTGLEAALWLQPAGSSAQLPEQLSLTAPEARTSGWRSLLAEQDSLALALQLPLNPPAMLALALVLRRPATAQGPCVLEWSEALGRRLGPARPAAPSLPLAPAPAPAAAASPPKAEWAGLRLVEHFASDDGGYRHLDLLLDQPRLGHTRWAQLRCKLALNGATPQLEFRLRPDWPIMFEQWPGQLRDSHGPVFVLPEAEAASLLAQHLPVARDARAVRLLLQCLPELVGALRLPPEAGGLGPWQAAAERMAATLDDA